MLDRFKLHPLTGLPLVPVGFRKDGRPIMPILGAAPEPDEPKQEPVEPDNDPKPDPKPVDKPDADDKGAGGKDALKADLAKERDKRQALEKSISDLKSNLAAALGVKPEESSDTDKLAASISDLQKKFDEAAHTSRLLTIANEFGVGKDDLHMLTATDEEGLRKQAEWIKKKNDALETSSSNNGKPRPDNSQGNPKGEPKATVATGRDLFKQRHGKKDSA